jgi:hypothetical protein
MGIFACVLFIKFRSSSLPCLSVKLSSKQKKPDRLFSGNPAIFFGIIFAQLLSYFIINIPLISYGFLAKSMPNDIGNSAIFIKKIHSFPSLSHGRFGFVGKISSLPKDVYPPEIRYRYFQIGSSCKCAFKTGLHGPCTDIQKNNLTIRENTGGKGGGSRGEVTRNVLKGRGSDASAFVSETCYPLSFRRIPASPASPEAKSQTAPGMGTTLTLASVLISVRFQTVNRPSFGPFTSDTMPREKSPADCGVKLRLARRMSSPDTPGNTEPATSVSAKEPELSENGAATFAPFNFRRL